MLLHQGLERFLDIHRFGAQLANGIGLDLEQLYIGQPLYTSTCLLSGSAMESRVKLWGPSTSDYCPWAYCRHGSNSCGLPQAPRKHIQPSGGPLKAFGQALREIRNEHGISQEQLALDCELDRTYISLIERGVQSPTIRTVAKLAEILGTKPSVLVLRMEQILDSSETGRKGKT